jgi:transcriptional regulator
VYLPAFNRIEDRAAIRAFLHAYNFATVITHPPGGEAWASHLPLLLIEEEAGDRLVGHMARANEQWRHWAAAPEVLCLFHGPHAYISPRWYQAKVAVPTWNYATVHVHGRARIETDPRFLRKVVEDTTAKHESHLPHPLQLDLPEDYMTKMLQAVVGFSIEITRTEAKFKLGQNRSAADRASMLAALESSAHAGSRELADFIKSQPPPAPPGA